MCVCVVVVVVECVEDEHSIRCCFCCILECKRCLGKESTFVRIYRESGGLSCLLRGS